MKTLLRFMLLSSFAAAGIALAVCVGISVDSADRRVSVSLAQETSEDACPTVAPKPTLTIAVPAAHIGRKFQPAQDRLENLALMQQAQAPLEQAQRTPPLPKQELAQAAQTSLDKYYEVLRQQMSAQPKPAAGSDGSLPVVPSGGSLPPAISPPPPAANPPPGPPPVGTALTKTARPVVKADPEGDGKLHIHIPMNTDIREVLDLLSETAGLNILASKEVQGKVAATLNGVDIDSALDAILKSSGYVTRRQGKYIFVGTPDEFNNMEQALDRVGTRVYRPNYVAAAELKALIQPLLTEKTGVVSVSSPAESGIAANDTTVGGDKYAGGDVVVVRDYEAVLAQVDQMVAEVDVRPLQISLEAMILSVKLNDTDTFGINFELLRSHMKFGWGSPLNALKDVAFKGGLKFGYLDHNVGAFLDALEETAKTDVIAKPQVMVLNKQRAEILIGDKKGYISTTVTETASTQAIDFLETGAQLRLRPFVSRDGLIRMEIHPELSDGDVKVVDGMTLPQKSVTEVTSNVMVRDGCTVVIGGLIKNQNTYSSTQIPVLGNLPGVGFLFRNKTETKERREVIVLITPRIVYEPGTCQEGAQAACEFHRRSAVGEEKMSPLGRRHIGRRYFRLAQAAWAKGQRDTALRFAEMAVQFDPESRAAIDLRSDIWQGKQCGAHTLDGPAAATAGPGALDGPEIAPWMLDDLARESPSGGGPAAAAIHPLDPGQPGQSKDIIRPRKLQ